MTNGRTSDAFLWLSQGGHRVAEFTPNGRKSGYYLADVDGTVELQSAARTNAEWDFTCTSGCGSASPTGSVTNVATGRVLEVTTARGKGQGSGAVPMSRGRLTVTWGPPP